MHKKESYEPQEDSYMLAEYVKKYAFGKVLDMGAGTGIQAEHAVRAKEVVCADISPEAVKMLQKKGFRAIQSDLFEKINETFDTIIFNPPYLPEHEHDKKPDTTGGPKGNEVLERFLSQAKKYLNKGGIILIVFSSLTPGFPEIFKKCEYEFKKIGEKKLFFEALYVYILR